MEKCRIVYFLIVVADCVSESQWGFGGIGVSRLRKDVDCEMVKFVYYDCKVEIDGGSFRMYAVAGKEAKSNNISGVSETRSSKRGCESQRTATKKRDLANTIKFFEKR